MIPNKSKPEWHDLVTGKKTYNLVNFVLQMRVTQAIKDIQSGKYKPEKAIDEIHELCEKYEKAVIQDMKTIFG